MSPDHKKAPTSFRDYVGGVKPLNQRSGRVPPAKAPTPTPHPPRKAASRGTEVLLEWKDDGVRMEGARDSARGKLRELKRAAFRAGEALDLHGMTGDEAQDALRDFFDRCRGPRERAVLVVHGKGTHSPGGRGVLRDEIAGWLASSPLADHVLCFATAQPRDGGTGAVYVLLASRR
jgi:DNA-nicking Smr family endonuclease